MNTLKKIQRYLILLFVFFTLPVFTNAQYEVLEQIPDMPTNVSATTYILGIIKFVMGFGTGLAVLMIMFGGIQMLFAAGNTNNISAGKAKITNAVVGLIIIGLSVLILNTINPNLLKIGGWSDIPHP